MAALNATTIHGIQPIWSKGKLDPAPTFFMRRGTHFRVRVVAPKMEPRFVGPETPPISSEVVYIDIDNDAATGIYHFQGDLKDVDFLRYEVNSLGARLRAGGSAAVIGVGGGGMSCPARFSVFIASWELRSTAALWMSLRGGCNGIRASTRSRTLNFTMMKAAVT